MNMKTTIVTICTTCTLVVGLGCLAAFQEGETRRPQGRQMGEALVAGLKATEGCLGVELARTMSGKNSIFAWFADRRAVERWYYSETHQQMIDTLTQVEDGDTNPKPLVHVPDETGPIMVIATITHAAENGVPGIDLPISQISIELYKPLPGGAFVTGRFAPKSLKVAHMRDFTPPAEPAPREAIGE